MLDFFFNSVHELVNPKTCAFNTRSTLRLTFIVLSKEPKQLRDLQLKVPYYTHLQIFRTGLQ